MKKTLILIALLISIPLSVYSVNFEVGYYNGACVRVMIFDNVGMEVFGTMDISNGDSLNYITYGISPLMIKVYDNNTLRVFLAAEYHYFTKAGDPGTAENIYGLIIPRLEYKIPFFENVWLRVLDLKLNYIKKRTTEYYRWKESTSYISNINIFSGVMFSF